MCGDTERIHETERMQIKYLKNDILLPLPEETERHDEGKCQITEDKKRNLLTNRHYVKRLQEVLP